MRHNSDNILQELRHTTATRSSAHSPQHTHTHLSPYLRKIVLMCECYSWHIGGEMAGKHRIINGTSRCFLERTDTELKAGSPQTSIGGRMRCTHLARRFVWRCKSLQRMNRTTYLTQSATENKHSGYYGLQSCWDSSDTLNWITDGPNSSEVNASFCRIKPLSCHSLFVLSTPIKPSIPRPLTVTVVCWRVPTFHLITLSNKEHDKGGGRGHGCGRGGGTARTKNKPLGQTMAPRFRKCLEHQ